MMTSIGCSLTLSSEGVSRPSAEPSSQGQRRRMNSASKEDFLDWHKRDQRTHKRSGPVCVSVT